MVMLLLVLVGAASAAVARAAPRASPVAIAAIQRALDRRAALPVAAPLNVFTSDQPIIILESPELVEIYNSDGVFLGQTTADIFTELELKLRTDVPLRIRPIRYAPSRR